nr:PI-PLC X domain-containing protein At5g67130-like [Tanacetum cinerariifolium]
HLITLTSLLVIGDAVSTHCPEHLFITQSMVAGQKLPRNHIRQTILSFLDIGSSRKGHSLSETSKCTSSEVLVRPETCYEYGDGDIEFKHDRMSLLSHCPSVKRLISSMTEILRAAYMICDLRGNLICDVIPYKIIYVELLLLDLRLGAYEGLCLATSIQCKIWDFIICNQPAINVLKEVQAFLEANPTEIITIIIEDYVTTQSGLTKIFKAAGLGKFWFPVSRMPSNGSNWPTVESMIQQNQRLVVFTTKSSKEASEGIAYTWRYLVENQYGSDGMKNGSCPNRAESSPMNTTYRSLVLLNHFTDTPDFIDVCKHNSAQLIDMMNTCYDAAGKRWPNFIAVDFYKRSDGGGAPAATDLANGQLVCGCDNIDTCRPKMKFGDCNPVEESPAPSPTIASSTSGSASTSTQSARGIGGGYKKGYSHSDGQQIQFRWLLAIAFGFLTR